MYLQKDKKETNSIEIKNQKINVEETYIYKSNGNFCNNNSVQMVLNKWVIVRISVFIFMSLILLCSLIFSSSLEELLNFDYFAKSVTNPQQCKIHFIDVGQGDCSVIQLPSNELVMIDTGPVEKWNKINTYFEFLQIPKKIDYLILTHTDKDHIGNAENILNSFDVKNIFIPKIYSNYEVNNGLIINPNFKILNNKTWNNICAKMYEKLSSNHIFYNERGLVIEDENKTYCLEFLSPFEEYYEKDNNYSPIIYCNMMLQRILFMGDCDNSIEKQFIKEYEDKFSNTYTTVLKVGHHGSDSSTSEEFIDLVKPHLAVISCGKDNSYGHPSNKTINILNNTGFTNIYRTDVSNSIMFFANIKPTGYSYAMEYEYENFDNFYIKYWFVVITLITLLFFSLIFPLFFSKKIIVSKSKINKKNELNN